MNLMFYNFNEFGGPGNNLDQQQAINGRRSTAGAGTNGKRPVTSGAGQMNTQGLNGMRTQNNFYPAKQTVLMHKQKDPEEQKI